MELDIYPGITNLFNEPKLHKIAKEYIGSPCYVNHEMYVTHEFQPDIEIAPTHFDKTWTLKFMLYVNDVGLNEGCFNVVPKSAEVARRRFRGLYEDNNIDVIDIMKPIYCQMNNEYILGELGSVVDIEGAASTLIIFDTDTFHHAGSVKRGRERKILRAHSARM